MFSLKNCVIVYIFQYVSRTYISDTRPAQCFSDIAANAVCSGAGAILLTRSTCCCQCKNAAWGFGESNCTACPAEDTKEFTDLCPHGCGYSPDGIGKHLYNFSNHKIALSFHSRNLVVTA